MSITVSFNENVTKEINRKSTLAKNLKPLFGSIAIKLHRSILKNFTDGGRPNKWIPSARAIRDNGQTLVDTGLLRASIGWNADAIRGVVGMENIGEKLTATNYSGVKNGAVVGTQTQYGIKHHDGLEGLPQRRFVMVQTQDEADIIKAVNLHLS